MHYLQWVSLTFPACGSKVGDAHRAKVVALLVFGDAGVDAVILAQHDLPGARVLSEQCAAVVDDKGRHCYALHHRTAATTLAMCAHFL